MEDGCVTLLSTEIWDHLSVSRGKRDPQFSNLGSPSSCFEVSHGRTGGFRSMELVSKHRVWKRNTLRNQCRDYSIMRSKRPVNLRTRTIPHLLPSSWRVRKLCDTCCLHEGPNEMRISLTLLLLWVVASRHFATGMEIEKAWPWWTS